MKINKKMMVIAGTVFINLVFLFSIFLQYSAYTINSETKIENINFYEPSRDVLFQLLTEGNTVLIVYNRTFSEEDIKSFVEIFSNKLYVFLVESNFSQTFIISPIYEKTLQSTDYEKIFKELCKASLEVPKECLEED